MFEVVLLLSNTDRFQQVEDYIRGCTTSTNSNHFQQVEDYVRGCTASTKYSSLSTSGRLYPRLYYFYQLLITFNKLKIMSEVVLLLPNTHRFQQVEVYIRGCTTSTKYWSLSASWRLCPRLYYFYQILTAFNTLSTVEEYPFYRWQLISFACRSHNAVTSFVYHKRKNKKYHNVRKILKIH
jgi:hypothetical protein